LERSQISSIGRFLSYISAICYQSVLTHTTLSSTATTPHATDHAIRSLRYFIGALVV
jgi:hypothetical protein